MPPNGGLIIRHFDADSIAVDANFHSANHAKPYESQPRGWWIEWWRDFHLELDPSESKLADLESKIACGPCRENYYRIKGANPPRFNDWFPWTVEIHNSVNAHVSVDGSHPQFSFSDAKACWFDVAPRAKPRLVITVATGQEYCKILNATRSLMEAYAIRCDADFIALTNKKFEDWKLEKFRVHAFAEQYDQTLFVDADCIIKSTCPDLFAMYPNEIAIHDDMPENAKKTNLEWAANELRSVLESQQMDDYPLTRLLNSGLVLCTREKNPWKPPSHPLPDSHCGEQFLVDHQVGSEFVSLPVEFNLQWWMNSFWERTDEAYVIHLANLTVDRAGVAKRMADGGSLWKRS